MTDFSIIHSLYENPTPGPRSYGRGIDHFLRMSCKCGLRWGNEAEMIFAKSNIDLGCSCETVAGRVIIYRKKGVFDNGYSFT